MPWLRIPGDAKVYVSTIQDSGGRQRSRTIWSGIVNFAPTWGFIYIYVVFSPYVGLPLLHFQMAPTWVYLQYFFLYFPLYEHYYSLVKFILGGIVSWFKIHTYIILMR